MGFRLRKSIKLMPGVRLNVSKSGLSTSIGGRGAKVNFSSRGVRTTVGIPGSGISYTSTSRRTSAMSGAAPAQSFADAPGGRDGVRPVGFLLGLGIFFMPYLFAWFLLRPGYSALARVISFMWAAVIVLPAIANGVRA